MKSTKAWRWGRTHLALVGTLACVLAACGGGEDDDGDLSDAGSAGGCAEKAPLPADLGIVDDDAEWLCGNLPEPTREDDNFGTTVSGVTSCSAGSGPEVTGETIYVAPGGSDSNAGDSPSTALATLQEALCRVTPGQTILLAPGTYEGSAAVAGLGGPDDPDIVIRGDGATPEDVVLDGERWRSMGVGLSQSWNVRIENLTVQHYIDAGIYTLEGGRITIAGIIARNNGRCSVFEDSEGEGFGINLVGTTDVAVEDSVFEDNGPLLDRVLCGEVLGTGINTFEVSGTFVRNTVRRTRGGAFLIEKGGPAVLENNRGEKNYLLAFANYWDAGIWLDESKDVVVTNNTFVDDWGGVGILVSDEEGAYPEASTGMTLTGNTVRGHLAGVHVWGYGVCPPPDDAITNWNTLESENTLENNVYQGMDYPVRCDASFAGGDLPE